MRTVQQQGEQGLLVLRWLAGQVQVGLPAFLSAPKLARRLAADPRLPDVEAQVASLVRREVRRSRAVGFLTSMAATIAAPLGVPAALAATWLLQARLAATIACLYGHDPADPWVQGQVVACLLGAVAPEGLRQVGVQAGEWAARQALAGVGRRVGAPLAARAARRSFQLGRLVPVVGALAGGVADGIGCRRVAEQARARFRAPSGARVRLVK